MSSLITFLPVYEARYRQFGQIQFVALLGCQGSPQPLIHLPQIPELTVDARNLIIRVILAIVPAAATFNLRTETCTVATVVSFEQIYQSIDFMFARGELGFGFVQ